MQVAEDQALIALSAEPELQDNFVDWNVRLGTPRNTSFTLLARRRMTGHPLNVPLPTVPGAANQRAEIRLDSGMLPIDLPSGFSQLPLPPKSTEESRLSYTADQVPSLIVERQTSRSSTLVCWSWQVEHALGNGRNVTVSINAKLTGNGLLRLPVPGTLKLLDGYLNDTRLSDDQMRLRDGTLVLDVAADQATHTLRLRFTSQELHTAALWHYTPTEILPQDLAVADQQTTVTPNADLWLLALRDAADRGSYWIVPAATGIVCGSAIACCCFVLGWLARRPKSQFIVHLIALSFGATAFFVQYPLQGWCIGWCIAVGVGRIASSFWNLSAPRLKTRGPSSVNLLGRRGSSPSQSLHANGPVIKAPMIGFLILTASWLGRSNRLGQSSKS